MNGRSIANPSRRHRTRRATGRAAAVTEGTRSALRLAAAASLAILFAGCTETGDFGRPRVTGIGEIAATTTGSIAAKLRDEPVSGFIFTDDEDELRQRAWRFLMPAHERAFVDGLLSNAVRTRVLPYEMHPRDRSQYFKAVMEDHGRSPASRYRRIAEDAAADAMLIEPFVAVAVRVMAADSMRMKSLLHVRDITDRRIRNAAARTAENRCLIAWVRAEAGDRSDAYRYAAERLFIEAPQAEAVDPERAIAGLNAARSAFDAARLPRSTQGACLEEVVAARPGGGLVFKD